MDNQKKNGNQSTIHNSRKIENGQETLKINNGINHKNGTYSKQELLKNIDTFGFKYGKDLANFIWQSIKSEKISKTKVTILNTKSTIAVYCFARSELGTPAVNRLKILF